ncbi:MAG: dienelactone hydrolase family protein [Desulfovibrio sp.]
MIATEIYGQNEYTAELARRLARHGVEVAVVDPYDGARLGPLSEQAAHERFLAECGPERYARLLAERAASLPKPLLAVGFSAGAVAVWALACADGVDLSRAICFYGSGIRHLADQKPCCPVDMILPLREPHFDVAALARMLAAHPDVTCHLCPWLHGFMNPLSREYAPEGYALWLARIQDQARLLSLPAS